MIDRWDYKNETEDAFSVLTPEQAVAGICIALALAAIFWPML